MGNEVDLLAVVAAPPLPAVSQILPAALPPLAAAEGVAAVRPARPPVAARLRMRGRRPQVSLKKQLAASKARMAKARKAPQ